MTLLDLTKTTSTEHHKINQPFGLDESPSSLSYASEHVCVIQAESERDGEKRVITQ